LPGWLNKTNRSVIFLPMSKTETRTQIVDTAIDLFWRASYHGTNMNDLSREAGVNKATVYQHFRSKEEIALAAVQRAAERTVAYVFVGAFEEKSAPLDRLREIYRRIYETQRIIFEETAVCRGCPFVNIGTELATSSEEVRQAVLAAFATFAPYYRKIVEELLAKDRLPRNTDVHRLAKDLQDNMNAVMISSKIENRPEAILEGGERAVRYLTT